MRITEGMIYNNFLSNINKIDEQINNVNNEIATGRKILSPSSDPISLTKALNINSELNMFSSYTKNINTSVSNLNAADSSLQNANNELMNIKNLAIQGANGTNDSDSYNALADNVDQELELLKNIANSSFEGNIFLAEQKAINLQLQLKINRRLLYQVPVHCRQTLKYQFQSSLQIFISLQTENIQYLLMVQPQKSL